MSQDLNELYQQVILDHNKKPRNFGELPDANHSSEGFNPLCGDHLWVYLAVGGDDKKINAIQFKGNGCAISKASASMMTEALKGKTVEEAQQLFKEFIALVKGELNPEKDEHHLGKLKIFSGIWRYPARVKCAALGWHTVQAAIEKEQQPISTE